MKKLLLGLLVLVSCFNVKADTCDQWDSLVRSIIEARYAGVSLSAAMKIANTNPDEFLKEMLIKIYELPNYSTKKYQQRAINDFANKIYIQCLKSKK
jgi:hypothetical protein